MVSGGALLDVANNVVPMYGAMGLGFLAARRGIIAQEGYEGLQTFLVLFCIPLLCLVVTLKTNLYDFNIMVMVSVFLHAMVCLLIAFITSGVFYFLPSGRRSFRLLAERTFVSYSILSFPNSLIVGVPVTVGMYGPQTEALQVFVVVAQTLLIVPSLVVIGEIVKVAREAEKERFRDGVSGNGEDSAAVVRDVEAGKSLEIKAGRDPYEAHPLQAVSSESTDNAVIAISPTDRPDNPSAYDKTNKQAPVTGGSIYPINNASGSSTPAHEGGMSAQASEIDERMSGVMETGVSPTISHRMPPKRSFGIHPTLLLVFNRLLTNPVLWASVVGIVYSLIAYAVNSKHIPPKMLTNFLAQFSNCVGGLALFNVGYFMHGHPLIPPRGLRGKLSLSLFLRLAVSPVMMGIVAWALSVRGLEWRTLTMQAALPQAVVTFTLAKFYDTGSHILGASVTFGTLISLPILMVYYYVIEQYPDFLRN
eukprot:comp19291_c0_seq1/m.22128 comp19291_c0_seq1/g.22128  ORF comp19291_c0_seq1/g.22128 comp19291_c0_seq1/m.22128 type:complete len:477 (-) comp19291_c0_seq1:479-1909(-)